MEMAFGNTIIHIEHFLTFNIRKIRYNESFLFSDNNSIILTYDEVLKTLELGQK